MKTTYRKSFARDLKKIAERDKVADPFQQIAVADGMIVSVGSKRVVRVKLG